MERKEELLQLGLSPEQAAAMGEDTATRIRIFRALVLVTGGLRNALDQRLAEDDLTTQQAALLNVAQSRPSIKDCAAVLATSHQNVKQIALALERKGFLRIVPDEADGRVKRLETTKKHDRFWAKRNPGDHAAVLEAFEDLSPAEARELFRLLGKVLVTSRKRRSGSRHPG